MTKRIFLKFLGLEERDTRKGENSPEREPKISKGKPYMLGNFA